jgi:hypothetical protein
VDGLTCGAKMRIDEPAIFEAFPWRNRRESAAEPLQVGPAASRAALNRLLSA